MLGVWSVLDPLRGWDRSVGDKEVGRLGYSVKFKKNPCYRYLIVVGTIFCMLHKYYVPQHLHSSHITSYTNILYMHVLQSSISYLI